MKENVLIRFAAQLFADYCYEQNLSSLELKDCTVPLGHQHSTALPDHQQSIPVPGQEGVRMGQVLPENLLRP